VSEEQWKIAETPIEKISYFSFYIVVSLQLEQIFLTPIEDYYTGNACLGGKKSNPPNPCGI
jgi:hypothetical protein